MNLENIIVYIFCVSAVLLQSLSELIWLFTSEIGQALIDSRLTGLGRKIVEVHSAPKSSSRSVSSSTI